MAALPRTERRMSVRALQPPPSPEPVRCECGFLIFDGEAIRARVVLPTKGLAKCRCKRWVEVPVSPCLGE